MNEKPILFSGPMVRAILEGRKTQTRRVSKDVFAHSEWQKGIAMWVRETWQYFNWTEDGGPIVRYAADDARRIISDIPEEWLSRVEEIWVSLSENCPSESAARDQKWRPSIFMPKWAARIWLEVVDVRVERVQDISGLDVLAEGVNSHVHKDANYFEASQRDAFRALWDSINAKRGFGWAGNPWVWVIEFKRVCQCP